MVVLSLIGLALAADAASVTRLLERYGWGEQIQGPAAALENKLAQDGNVMQSGRREGMVVTDDMIRVRGRSGELSPAMAPPTLLHRSAGEDARLRT